MKVKDDSTRPLTCDGCAFSRPGEGISKGYLECSASGFIVSSRSECCHRYRYPEPKEEETCLEHVLWKCEKAAGA